MNTLKLYISAAILLVILGFTGYETVKAYRAEVNLQKVQAQNVDLTKQLSTLTDVNAQNKKVLDQIVIDQQSNEQHLQAVRDKIKKDNESLAKIQTMISTSTPQDNGTISPVLRNTIDGIQQARKAREGASK
jgi:hypothetical protein